jgi:iron(III) transport system ATP-binding protein
VTPDVVRQYDRIPVSERGRRHAKLVDGASKTTAREFRLAANVRVHGLLKRFGDFTAVDRIDLDIKAGQIFTLLGPSGCGKTTTLRMIAGLEHPTGGEIYVGERLVSAPERGIFVPPERRHMGMVFQSYAIWPHMTVFENVAFPLQELRLPKAEVRERTMATLDLVGLADYAKRPAPLLSGGQQQRVALARALAPSPEVLLLDEPLSNLDARLREQMRFEIRNTQARLGITTIFVTHDQLEAMTLSDEVAVMNTGHVDQVGPPREVYEDPRTRYVMDFLGQVNHLRGRIRIVDGAAHAEVGTAGRVRVTDVHGLEDGAEVVIGFRSESVRFATDERDLVGTVTTATYIGGYLEFVIDVAGQSLVVRGGIEQEWPVGSEVGLRLSRKGVRAWSVAAPTPEPDPAAVAAAMEPM